MSHPAMATVMATAIATMESPVRKVSLYRAVFVSPIAGPGCRIESQICGTCKSPGKRRSRGFDIHGSIWLENYGGRRKGSLTLVTKTPIMRQAA